jgi:serine phosphatase RsbU (regulator of sigma subunit)
MDINSLTQKKKTSFFLKKVLLIDDEPLVRESMSIYLEDSGYLVMEASNGIEGLELFHSFKPDVILCDLRMPKMDGLHFLSRLNQCSPETPLIMISGVGQIHDVVEALRLGALDYLIKPISDLAILENAVQNAIHRRNLEIKNECYKNDLELAHKELEKNFKLLEADQNAGRQAQLQLLPPANKKIAPYHFQHTMIPSLNLSGDFIDYFEIDENYIGFYFADVSGHGAAAAFTAITLKSLINQPIRDYRMGVNQTIIHPKELMRTLNHELIHANLGKHITLFYGVIHRKKNTMNYAVAGQYPAPILISENQYIPLKERGFPLGLLDWATFEEQTIKIPKNITFLMVSDGWLDVIPKNSQKKGEAFLMEYITQHPISIDSLMAPIRKEKMKYYPDDISIFIIDNKDES